MRAAYKCFERSGIERTSIDSIATEAGVTRPTVYRYFASKADIVNIIAVEESRKVNVEVRRRLVRGQKFADLVADALVLIVRIAIENPYLRRITAYRDFGPDATAPKGAVHQIYREWWAKLLERAAEDGELASHLDVDEILVWLTLCQRMLLTHLEHTVMDDNELRRLVRCFVVTPLLAQVKGDNRAETRRSEEA